MSLEHVDRGDVINGGGSCIPCSTKMQYEVSMEKEEEREFLESFVV